MMQAHDDDQQTPTLSRVRVRLAWITGVVALVVALVVTPPLLNVSRLRKRIAASMSASLGRPVHLDGVTLKLLPIPGFTLENLIVSEDPAFGNEPVIRANTVEITLRPSSLWRRQVEISSIRFVEPSLNIVRNPQGQWNLQSLLMHAAQVNTAPTAQSQPGPAPRFPYIEATNGRVNVKLGDEKQPFSLVEADFALWLPSAEQWQVRLVGRPARTDRNVTGAGTMRLEGSLRRAATLGDVPVALQASWHDAPLGEASLLLTGADAGWRGTLNVDVTLTGAMHAARLAAQAHANDLRRADFVPARLLDVDLECNGTLDAARTLVRDPSCTLPTPVTPGQKAGGQVAAIADAVQLGALRSGGHGVSGLRLGMTNVADSYVLDWARMFSQRIAASASPRGTVAGSVTYSGDATDGQAVAGSQGEGWQGEFHADVDESLPWEPKPDATHADATTTMTLSVSADQGTLTLAPLNLTPAAKAGGLELTGGATLQGYSLQLAGTGTSAELRQVLAVLPPLGDGVAAALPGMNRAGDEPLNVDMTCSRAWGGVQSCVAASVPVKPVKRPRR